MPNLPILPYPDAHTGTTSGHSGSDTSRRLAENADANGETKGQQKIALRLLNHYEDQGITWTELLQAFQSGGYPKAHHGAASRTLSNLHRAGLIARLTETRGERKIYVLPQYIGDRGTELPRDQTGPRAFVLTEPEEDAIAELNIAASDLDRLIACISRRKAETLVILLKRLGVNTA